MTTIYDHRTNPPTRLIAHGSCVTAPGYVSAPVANLPEGLYLAGPDDPVPVGMVAVSWTRVVRDGRSVNVPTLEPAPSPISPNLAEAVTIMADPAAVEAVRRVSARVTAVAALGVNIADWTIQGVLDAAEAAISTADAERGAVILRHGACLHAEWLIVIYHCNGDIVRADDLWPYLYELANVA